ncbi:MAG: LacI family DNA-binding transcriptional regulator [Armatimonadetes bacterium]|nr:LacI family DNA-binding transcriptional regulator [Armatimonadota bacterium]
MAVTLKDVASEAGVAVSTASRVLRGDPHPMIGAGTRERVMEAARRLRYRHNVYARQLALGRSEVVGIFASALMEGVNLAKFQALESAIRARGYRPLLGHTAGHDELQVQSAKEFISSAVEGVVVANAGRGHRHALEVLAERRIPIVSLEPLEGVEADIITVDRRAGARLAIRHLLDLGHRRIAMLHSQLDRSPSWERYEGYREALAEYGCSVDPSLLVPIVGASRDGSYALGYETARHLLAIQPLPTAAFCSNDEIAIGAMKALAEAGLRIPEEMALVGFDDIKVAAYAPVPLTTVAQPVAAQAEQAVALLFEHIANQGPERPPQVVQIEPRLVVRASCGAAAAGRERRAEA